MTCLIANANMLSLPTPTFSFSLLPFTLKYTKVPRVILLSCHTRVCIFRHTCGASNWSVFAMVYGNKMSMFAASKEYFSSIKRSIFFCHFKLSYKLDTHVSTRWDTKTGNTWIPAIEKSVDITNYNLYSGRRIWFAWTARKLYVQRNRKKSFYSFFILFFFTLFLFFTFSSLSLSSLSLSLSFLYDLFSSLFLSFSFSLSLHFFSLFNYEQGLKEL